MKDIQGSDEVTKIDRYLNLLLRTKDKRVTTDGRVLDLSKQILNSNVQLLCRIDALKLLMASQKGIEILRAMGDDAIRIMVATIHDGWYYSGDWQGTPTWYNRYNSAKNKIFLEISTANISLAVNLLVTRVWDCFNARESENLVDVLSIVSKDVQMFRTILLTHWTAYARQAAARALAEIGSKDAINVLVEGLSSPYSVVLREILIALGRKGNVSALPALEKLSEDPLLTESNVGHLQKAIQKIKNREKDRKT